MRIGGGSANATQMPLWFAKEGGYYEKNGLSVESVSIPESSLALQAMLSGELPIDAWDTYDWYYRLGPLANVDAKRIGIWGGSYGGYLTALALAHDSDIFKAGVDLHGVHNWISERRGLVNDQLRYEKSDIKKAIDVAWTSSPVSAISTSTFAVPIANGAGGSAR